MNDKRKRGPKIRFPQSVTVSFRVPQGQWEVAATLADKEKISLADAHRAIYERGVAALNESALTPQPVA